MPIETAFGTIPPTDELPPTPLSWYVATALQKLRLLYSRRTYLMRITALSFATSIALAMFLPVRYEATAYLMPPDGTSMISGLSLMTGLAGGDASSTVANRLGDVLGMQSPGQLYIRALRSRTVQDRVIERFGLMSLYGAKVRADAREELETRTSLREDRKSGVISIAVVDTNSNRAAQMANAYVEELDRLLLEVNVGVATRERHYYEQQLATAKSEMQRASKELSEFAGNNSAINVPEQGKAAVESVAVLQGQLFAAEAQLKGLLQTYVDGKGPVQALRAQIAELRKQLNALDGKDGSASTGLPNVKQLSALSVPYLNLYQKLKIQEAVVEALSQQYELAKLQEARRVPTIKVLEQAEVPEKKSFPPRVLIVVVLTVLGGLVASAWVIAKDWWTGAASTHPWKMAFMPVSNDTAENPFEERDITGCVL